MRRLFTRLVFTLGLVAGLGGCQILNGPPLPPRLPAAGAWLVLHQDLDVPAGMARVHIQNGRVVSHETLLRRVWGPQYEDRRQYLKLYIWYLRQKVEDNPSEPKIILTERGVGYRIVAAQDQD